MTSIVINGNAYSDDGSTPQDMQHYGYLTHLLPMIGDTATVAGQVATDAAQAALDAVTASNGALALRGTSTTSLAVSAGTSCLRLSISWACLSASVRRWLFTSSYISI